MLGDMRFSGVWRDYQQRVIDEVDQHLDDDRINVVAAPGSGKTVLGLELVRKLGRPALILAPSLTIRNQWGARLVPLFLDEPPRVGEVSHSLDAPGTLTAVTYQSLHAVWAEDRQPRLQAFLNWASEHGPLTLVLDEAHHLRREWWRALDDLIARLSDPRIVALTATPPYDAPLAEWRRFESACGPIDIEIGIPELVRNGDLAPHQDHVVFSRPSPDLQALLDERREAIAHLIEDMRSDDALTDRIADHPWLRLPLNYLEPILDNPTVLSSMLVHLAAVGRPLPADAVSLLGTDARHVPMQTERWFEALLNALLYDLGSSSPLLPEERKRLSSRLHAQGLIEGDRVRLSETKRIVRMMAGDRVKIASIEYIAKVEAEQLKSDLRMVVLTDHVRAGELPRGFAEDFAPAKIGVAPIFETLRRSAPDGQAIGILTGTLVVLPEQAVPALHAAACRKGIAATALTAVPMPHCQSHVRIVGKDGGKRALVSLVTELFERGDITILVGTQALLGEGWDAPAINSLVLASNSASFMLSNQMRGRAIRIDPAQPDKVANIWHLATVADPAALNRADALRDDLNWGDISDGQPMTADIKLLARRFDAFAGISNGPSQRIGTGLGRLALSRFTTVHEANLATFARAADRPALARDWAASTGDAPPRAHVREVATPKHTPRRLVWRNTLESLATSGLGAGAVAGSYAIAAGFGAETWSLLLAGAATAGFLATLPRTLRAAHLAWRNGSLENSLKQVGEMILHGLRSNAFLTESEYRLAGVRTARDIDGSRMIYFEGLTRSVDLLAVNALAELLGPVQNPRYLLVRRGGIGHQSRDYHAIPAVFSKNREAADAFAREWSRRIGASRAVWTRSETGRRDLLLARKASLAAGMRRRVDRRSDWR